MQRPNTSNGDYALLLSKARDAKRGGERAWRAQSTGEKLAVAMALNQPEWISDMGYALPEAIDRIGLEWLAFIPEVARQLQRDEVVAPRS